MNFGELLDGSIPPNLQQAIVTMVVDEYGHAHSEVFQRYAPEEAADIEPHVRRANIETALIELGDRFQGVVVVSVGTNIKGNRHRVLRCGNLVLTQSYIENGQRVPREAAFRNTFAGNPNQMFLNPAAEEERIEKLKEQDRIYAIITHTPSFSNPAEPSHVSIEFVDEDCKHVETINLIERCRIRAIQAIKVEVVEDRQVVKLRTDVTTKTASGA